MAQDVTQGAPGLPGAGGPVPDPSVAAACDQQASVNAIHRPLIAFAGSRSPMISCAPLSWPHHVAVQLTGAGCG
jgi:hypothetical protein